MLLKLLRASNISNTSMQQPAQLQQNQEDTSLQHRQRRTFTSSTPTIQELHSIIKEMRSNVSPGPDGLSAAFYKSTWSWISNDIYKLVTDFYNSAFMIPEINQTFLVLIPKKSQPTVPQDFRPISLCNVAYKIIAKSIVERLKRYLPDYIDHAQAAFVKQRHISSNIIITQEIIHSFQLRSWKQQAFILKIDLAKGFDRLNWNFIVTALRRLSLSHHFINLVYACISTTTLSVLVNGEPSNHVKPNRGIRQGFPLSPYLFVVAMNELSIALQHEMQNQHLTGISLGPRCMPIHSLLFADDLILGGQATVQEATTIKAILQRFCDASGQTPNLQKSAILFRKNVRNETISAIKNIFPVTDLQPHTKHLGHPIIFNHGDRNKAYNFIFGKFHSKLTTVRANKLNHAGRLTYI